MKLSEDLKSNAKKMNRVILFGKPSDCKYCQGVSASIWVHYACINKNCKQYGGQPPLCSKDCAGYEKEE